MSQEAIEARYQASIDPEVVANPPLRRPKSLRALWRMDLTRDPRLAATMPNCDLLMVAGTGHWVQWERAELFNRVVTDFLS